MEDSAEKRIEELLRFLEAHNIPLGIGYLVDPTPALKAMLKIQVEKGDKTLLNLLLKLKASGEKYRLLYKEFDLAKAHPWLFGKELLEETLRTLLKYQFVYANFLLACYKEEWKEAEKVVEKLNSLVPELDEAIKKLEEKVM